MGLLTKEQILAAQDIEHEEVDVPEWAGTVRISTMTGTARDAWELAQYTAKDEGVELNRENIRARLVAATALDEAGALLFTVDDVVALGRKSAKALDRCYDVASRLNGLRKKDIDELVKP